MLSEVLIFFNLLNNSFILFLIADFVSLSYNSGSSRFKTSTLWRFIQLSEAFDCTSPGVFRQI